MDELEHEENKEDEIEIDASADGDHYGDGDGDGDDGASLLHALLLDLLPPFFSTGLETCDSASDHTGVRSGSGFGSDDLAWSPAGTTVESYLQRGPFLLPSDDPTAWAGKKVSQPSFPGGTSMASYGSRSISVVASVKHSRMRMDPKGLPVEGYAHSLHVLHKDFTPAVHETGTATVTDTDEIRTPSRDIDGETAAVGSKMPTGPNFIGESQDNGPSEAVGLETWTDCKLDLDSVEA